MTKLRTTLIMTALIGSFGAAGCNQSPAEEHNEAVQAQREADQKIKEANNEVANTVTEAQKEATQKAAELQQKAAEAVNDANKKIAEAQQDARHDVAEAQANANEKIREANRDIVAGKDELHDWGQKKLDEVNNLIDDTKVKAQKAEPKARAEFDASIKAIQEKRDEIATQVAALGTQSARDVNAWKERVGMQIDQLKTRVEKLNRTL